MIVVDGQSRREFQVVVQQLRVGLRILQFEVLQFAEGRFGVQAEFAVLGAESLFALCDGFKARLVIGP